MPIRVYNALTQKKEPFQPIHQGKAGIYVCGITAYDACHIGHARAAVNFDVIVRWLKQSGYEATYVRNYTDIDDKIIARAQETKTPWKALTEKYIAEYQEDMRRLNVQTPTIEPKATEHISLMVAAIQKLVENGKAYEASGSVYYSVRSFGGYGKLSHKNIEELKSGARVEIDEAKKDPLDFSLWKAAKPGEPTWDSPWGPGRPGWHIECSVMSAHYLGQPFDIHGGGRDLIFPHHENEIAQAEGVGAKKFCNYFLHNGFININAEKMSKSLKNFKTIREVAAQHTPEVVRYFLLSAHYGSPLDYTERNMADARAACDRFYLLGQRLEKISLPQKAAAAKPAGEMQKGLANSLQVLGKKFQEAMDDDFNTAAALGAVFETVRLYNRYLDSEGVRTDPFSQWAKVVWEENRRRFHDVLGILGLKPSNYFEQLKKAGAAAQKADVDWIEKKIKEREEARGQKNFKKGDAIRDELAGREVELKDRPDGSTEWHFKKGSGVFS